MLEGLRLRSIWLLTSPGPATALRFLTRSTVLGLVFAEPWMRSEPALAHARLYFPEFVPEAIAVDATLVDAVAEADASVGDYVCFLLLDFAAADPTLEDVPLAHALRLADNMRLRDRLEELAHRELRVTKKALTSLRQTGPDLLAQTGRFEMTTVAAALTSEPPLSLRGLSPRERLYARSTLLPTRLLHLLGPLFEQVAESHARGKVAPLQGLNRLSVAAGRAYFSFDDAPPPSRNPSALARIDREESSATLEIQGRHRVDETAEAFDERHRDLSIGNPGEEITRPVFLAGYVCWEHEEKLVTTTS